MLENSFTGEKFNIDDTKETDFKWIDFDILEQALKKARPGVDENKMSEETKQVKVHTLHFTLPVLLLCLTQKNNHKHLCTLFTRGGLYVTCP